MRLPQISPGQRLLAGLTAAGLIVVFCLGLIWIKPGLFWNDDYQISILPVLADMARSWREGHWPLLSPYSWACGNLAGEYQYGTFSLFVNAAVVVVFALWTDFASQAAALSIIHLAALGAGAYLLARGRRLPAALATVVALIAALNGWEVGWGATDWFGALAADAWLPWAWWAFERAMRKENEPRWRLLPAPFVYLVLTGGFPYTVVRLGLVTAWLGVHALAARRWRALWPLVLGWGFGLLLSAPAWLSLLEAIHGSSRSQGAGAGNFAWTVPLKAWPGLILPNWSVYWHDFSNRPSLHSALELTGGFVPVAGLLAAFAARRGWAWRTLRWDLGLLGGVLLLCVLPSPGVFRWSFRWLPLFHLVLALAGARALHLLIARRGLRWPGNAGLWAVGLTGAAWLAMVLTGTDNPDAITRYLPAWTLAVAVGWLVLAAVSGRQRALWVPLLATVASLWAAYQHEYTSPGVPIYGFGPSLARTAPLSPDRLYLSLYRMPHFSYWAYQTGPDFGAVVRPGSTEMFAGVHTVNGYSPIMPPGVGRLWNMETHGSIPEDVGRQLLREEANRLGLLARIGVDGLLVAHDFPLEEVRPPTEEWEQVFASPEGTVYHRRGSPLPEVRAWQEAPGATPGIVPWELPPLPAPEEVRVNTVESSRAGISADVDVPAGSQDAVLAFRRPYFPGYEARLNGNRLPVGSFRGLLPTVELPPGSHGRLTLRYLPSAVVQGSALAMTGLLGMGAFALFTRRQVRAG